MNCPKCQSSMEAGVILDSRLREFTKATCWIEAKEHKLRTQADAESPGQYEVDSYRCTKCGFLEMYAGGNVKA